jgi:4-aminobutyrate aminotransferase-like enzyme
VGTCLGFDVATVAQRDALLKKLKEHGINQGPSGNNTVRFRPCLYFDETHVDIYAAALNKACSEL